jgi:hypothetical protein
MSLSLTATPWATPLAKMFCNFMDIYTSGTDEMKSRVNSILLTKFKPEVVDNEEQPFTPLYLMGKIMKRLQKDLRNGRPIQLNDFKNYKTFVRDVIQAHWFTGLSDEERQEMDRDCMLNGRLREPGDEDFYFD